MTASALRKALLAACALTITGASVAQAQARRALLIGIDKYGEVTSPTWRTSLQREVAAWRQRVQASPAFRTVGDPSTGLEAPRRIGSLDGAVNDARSMQALLVSRFQFPAANARLLSDAEATRDGILAALKKLADETKPGDMVVVYYAGHGAQRVNSLLNRSGKLNHLEETLVPVDATIGQFDLRSVDINPYFNQIIDKGASLTLIFDSCHSGSVTRGEPASTGKVRLSGVDMRDAMDASVPPAPDEKGAVVMAAALDQQFAKEYVDPATGQAHGAFTWALLRALRRTPNAPASRVFAQVRAVLLENDLEQIPLLRLSAGKDRPLFSTTPSGASDRTYVAVQRVAGDTIYLLGGSALGIAPETKLAFADPEHRRAAVELKVADVKGPAVSRAVAVTGRAATLAPGDLLAVTEWTAADAPLLTTWIAPSLDATALAAALRGFAPLRESQVVEWVNDPTSLPADTRPLYWVRYDGKSWVVVSPEGETRAVSGAPGVEQAVVSMEAAALARAEQAAKLSGTAPDARGKARVFLLVPPTPEMRSRLAIGQGSANPAVAVTTDLARADVLLAGRMDADGTVSRAWLSRNGRDATVPTSSFPVRTSWYTQGNTGASQADSLQQSALALARIAGWIRLAPPGGTASFPYRLMLRNRANHEEKTTGTTREGEIYDLVIRRDSVDGDVRVKPHYVYVMGLDSWGNGTLLWSSANQVPPADVGNGGAPLEFRLTTDRDTIQVQCPYGVDTFLMLASQEPIDEQVFSFSGVRNAVRAAGDSPLAALLRDAGQAKTRGSGSNRVVPTTWSLDKVAVRSVGPDGTSNNRQCTH